MAGYLEGHINTPLHYPCEKPNNLHSILIQICDLCKSAKNTFGKYVYSSTVHAPAIIYCYRM